LTADKDTFIFMEHMCQAYKFK
jgi:predicted transcriptional regulator